MLSDVRHAVPSAVDDVRSTGRSVRAALNELLDVGRPQSVGCAVLIERGYASTAGSRGGSSPPRQCSPVRA
ncbi:MAG: hypothetical protein HYZ81_27025 [Nitrospinae bacterium]|nr:hypothetical protein [Nitrospinota bacterium]